jgi:hypothetical protein
VPGLPLIQYGEDKGPHQRKKYLNLTKGLASFQMAPKLHCQEVQVMESLMDTLYSLVCFCSQMELFQTTERWGKKINTHRNQVNCQIVTQV